MTAAVESLIKVIAYPETLVEADGVVEIVVDGGTVRVWEKDGRVVFARALTEMSGTEDLAVTLAGYAAGRSLKEEAVLAWDPTLAAPILWQDVSARADAHALERAFALFCTSCDWWLARVDEGGPRETVSPDMMILP